VNGDASTPAVVRDTLADSRSPFDGCDRFTPEHPDADVLDALSGFREKLLNQQWRMRVGENIFDRRFPQFCFGPKRFHQRATSAAVALDHRLRSPQHVPHDIRHDFPTRIQHACSGNRNPVFGHAPLSGELVLRDADGRRFREDADAVFVEDFECV